MAPPTLEELIYYAAQRALDQQGTALSDLRTRTSTLVLRAARGLHDVYLENERVIKRREKVFGLALFALGAETLLWVLTLALS